MATLYTIKGTTLPALPKAAAIQRYQNQLLAGGQFQKVVSKAPAVAAHVATGQCKKCFDHLHGSCTREACECNCRMFQT